MPLKGWLQLCHLPEGPEGSLNWPILSLLKSESRLPIFRGGKKSVEHVFSVCYHTLQLMVLGTFSLEIRFTEPPPCLVLY